MKKRFFALIIVLGFVLIFISTNNLPTVESEHEEELTSLNRMAVKAANLEVKGELAGEKIVLDAGHGGFDSGSVGQNETYEKDIALSTVLTLKDMLEDKGATVLLTRDRDDFVSLRSRTQVASTHRANLFLSIHTDGFEDAEAKGMTTYYYSDQDEIMADTIHTYIFKDNIDTENRGVDFGNYQVLRDTYVPAVLLELGYITNVEDEQLLNTEQFQETVSERIVQGIIQYVTMRTVNNDEHNYAGEGHMIAN